MRPKKEIKQAIDALRKQGDDVSLIQAQTLADGLTERQVFQKYVVEQSDDDRHEKAFFAARDAARYAAGRLELSELMIYAEEAETTESEVQESTAQFSVASNEEMIQVPLHTFRNILNTLKQLEEQVCGLCGIDSEFNPPLATNGLMEMKEALVYIGCGATTLRRWMRKRKITSYLKGSCIYFSKCELDNNPIIQRYKSSKQVKEA